MATVPAVAPGPRMIKFHDALTIALERTLGKLPEDVFLKCFPPEIVSKYKSALLELHDAILRSVYSNATKEFEVILNEHHIAEKLNKLDDIIIQQPYYGNGGQRVPLPATSTPADDMRREGHEMKLKEKENLTKLLKQLETDNADLKAKLQSDQNRKEQLTGELAKIHAEIEKALETSKAWESDNVKQLLAQLPKNF